MDLKVEDRIVEKYFELIENRLDLEEIILNEYRWKEDGDYELEHDGLVFNITISNSKISVFSLNDSIEPFQYDIISDGSVIYTILEE